MTDRKEFRDLADPADARDAIASLDLAPDPEEVPLAEARGRVLADRIDAQLDVPGFDRASMDGYAVRARDTFGADETDPATLDLAGTVHAGEEPDVAVGEGEAVEISTGAVMPPGADGVVMVERTDESEEGEAVAVRTAVAPGDNVMLAGADVAAGERALGPGTRLTAREIGLLSALGVESVPVRGKPTVGIVSTGDELVRPGEEVDSAAGQIYDVNSYTVAAAVEEAGGEPKLYPHAGDDYDEMEAILREAAAECDLVLSSGSTSASAVDVIYRVIEERGELLLHGVAVKPGKPMLVGRVGDSAYVGLPGYPVSALTIFRTFVAPAIRRAAGVPEPATATVEARMAAEERYGEGRMRMMPVGLTETGEPRSASNTSGGAASGDLLAYVVDKGSGATTSLVEADGVVEVPADTAYLAEGETVEVQLFSPDVRPPTVLGVGEDDPALARLLDAVERPRYLSVGSREGLRRLRDGVPDFAVTSGEPADSASDRGVDATELASYRREWGLVVPSGNPEDIAGLADLVDRDLRFVNRGSDSGLRTSLGNALADLADERGATRHDLVESIDGFELAAKAHESPARKVAAGRTDAGLGLRATAEKLGLGFVPVDTETVRVLANPDRESKPGVRDLDAALDERLDAVLGDLPGFDR
ncbi:molybdopterin biosynthesis protein [Halorussus gelatinilyticus]|uniref:Molybdopterin biosynthesis protein n=1 Tax=Halorussus gelatinilyticus TaxID=2937524 RepID=A0A8U0ILH0_9EURY|nr:molybdopterin biosynthesis protein [Halorussus gelatinilyticus]UPW00889.1 molybdopterin biosynthesis protein [Halorussus gelatinilyticus]